MFNVDLAEAFFINILVSCVLDVVDKVTKRLICFCFQGQETLIQSLIFADFLGPSGGYKPPSPETSAVSLCQPLQAALCPASYEFIFL